MDLLRQSVAAWRSALAVDGTTEAVPIFVTVDGLAEDVERVVEAIGYEPAPVYQVGQHDIGVPLQNRMGVAANKNTGLELLMDAGVEHLFLSDDDTWPLYPQSLGKHTDLGVPHSMVCWSKHRLDAGSFGEHARWSWPRGAMLYMTREVVNRVGGMVEAFGPGGHEHVEYSQRIYNAGLTPAPFISPASYATRDGMGAAALWHAEDMRRPGEPLGNHRLRRRELTSVRRTDGDWEKINEIMAEQQGSADFVPYWAGNNGRASATLCSSNPSQGAGQNE